MTDAPAPARRNAAETGALLSAVFIIAICGLIYELVIGSLSTYLLGDSILQFSLTIGIFLTAMGIGSWLSRFFRTRLLETFLWVELLVGLVGGCSATLLLATYALLPSSYLVVMIGLLLLLGGLIGLEIPLLTRITADYGSLRETLSSVLTFDYIGALAASLVFPLLLLPWLGLAKTSYVVGAINVLVVALVLVVFGRRIERQWRFAAGTLAALALLGAGLLFEARAVALFEHRLYQDEILYAEQSRFQRIIVTGYRDDLRLYLDSELQFSSRDEYRYHEALVHPAMSAAVAREHVLIIGGGDGLALREVLKYPDVQRATLVDLDPAMTRLAREFGPLVRLNGDALRDPRVSVVNSDGYGFLAESSDLYQVIIVDLPDPRNEALARLYSREFYGLVRRHLAPGGAFVTQSASPYIARSAYWCIVHTVEAAGLTVQPYHLYIPSFGDWGFTLASDRPIAWEKLVFRVPLRYLDQQLLVQMAYFDTDSARLPTDISHLENAAVWRYYLEAHRNWRS